MPSLKKNHRKGQAWWLTPIIPPTQKVEIRGTMDQGHPRQKVSEIPSQPIAGHGRTHDEYVNRKNTVQVSTGEDTRP
jgi:hypothetical protein